MRSSDHDKGSHQQRMGAQENSQAGTTSSSFVSTLSNALNISTPKESKTNAHTDAHLSAPAKLARVGPALDQVSPTKAEALRTPTRSREPPPMLSLTGHEAFQSPNTPVSPWITAPVTETATGGFVATQSMHGFAGEPSTSAAPDTEWLLSGPSSGRTTNIFETSAFTASPTTAASSGLSSQESHWHSLSAQRAPGNIETGPAPTLTLQSTTFADPLRQSIGESRLQGAGRATIQEMTSASSAVSPTSMTNLSPFPGGSASTVMDGAFFGSVLEQETPCLSTHLLPNHDLPEVLSTRLISSSNEEEQLLLGRHVINGADQDNVFYADDRETSGLGLDLNTDTLSEHIEVLTSPTQQPKRPSMSVDEMGQWMQRQSSGGSWQSEASTEGSKATRERRTTQRASTASFSTEASFTSQSNSSTWDSSFAESSSPTSAAPSAFADSQFFSTPASSIGLGGISDVQLSKVAGQLRVTSESRSEVATPEVAMHDFSEFGQSVSIEQMAEERWRTWPRTSDSVLSHHRHSTSIATISSAPAAHSVTEEPRASFESLSVSTPSTRSRLMAEPYNKNMRSGRPSSSASTSSRSSISNVAALEGQQNSGAAGPTRPRSYIAAGSLRMSSTTRASSNGGTGPDSGQIAGERTPSTAMALRRARGKSHSFFSPSSSSSNGSAMKSTRSADAFVPPGSSSPNATQFRHSIAMQRSATSVEAPTQRPQSMPDTSSQSESPRPLGACIEGKSKSKVGFNEVSVALDTLRMFLKQKSDGDSAISNGESGKETNEASTSDKPTRTLRRAKGVLPPRGVASHVDEFGALKTPASASHTPALNEASTPSASHHRSKSLGGAFSPTAQSVQSSRSRQDDKLAVLEDLSERVLRLQAESELEKERHAAASMPPPPARPVSMMHQRTQSSMTRREMHEEYLRKRASEP